MLLSKLALVIYFVLVAVADFGWHTVSPHVFAWVAAVFVVCAILESLHTLSFVIKFPTFKVAVPRRKQKTPAEPVA